MLGRPYPSVHHTKAGVLSKRLQIKSRNEVPLVAWELVYIKKRHCFGLLQLPRTSTDFDNFWQKCC